MRIFVNFVADLNELDSFPVLKDCSDGIGSDINECDF